MRLQQVKRADFRIVRSLPALHFDVTKVSLASRIEHQMFSVLRTGHGRNTCGVAVIFVTDSVIVFISVE